MFQAATRSPFSRVVATAVLACSLLLGGCVYRMTVQQGNFLDARQVVQVKEGMTRAQVRFLLGTPMLPDAFDRDRWDYLYTLDLGKNDKPTRQRLTIFFADDKVSRIENDGAPTEVPADQKPAEEKPADTKPADAKPADASPADSKPADAPATPTG